MTDIFDAGSNDSPSSNGVRVPIWLNVAMFIAAVGGGWTAVAIAIVPSIGDGSALVFAVFLLAPFYEEALKPLGVYYIFFSWPHVALSRLKIASLSAVGGLTFALVESWLYVETYPEEGSDFILFRFTAPVAMHVLASFTLGLGLSPGTVGQLWRGRVPPYTRKAYFTAVGIHAVYNITVVLLTVIGVRELVEQTSA